MVRWWVLVHCGCQKLTHASTLETLNEDKKQRECVRVSLIEKLNTFIIFILQSNFSM
jgi:hypothetical protein